MSQNYKWVAALREKAERNWTYFLFLTGVRLRKCADQTKEHIKKYLGS